MAELAEQGSSCGPTELENLDYLRGVKSSTCLLLPTTPSPTPLEFKHPLAEEFNEGPFLTLNDEPTNMQNMEASAGDSSSSGDSNSMVQDPVSAQLINNISMLDYQTLSKNGDLIMGQVDDCKLNGNTNLNNRKLPGFVNWNWGVIRKIVLWVLLSGLIACLGAIIAMVINIPKQCNPDLPWHQGKVFYEIFPASFKDSDNDGIGDLNGVIKKLDYINGLGASTIRLNYIFEASSYPDHYKNVKSLFHISPSIGHINDFKNLIAAVHDKNMTLVIDIPVLSMTSETVDIATNITKPVTFDGDFKYIDYNNTSDAIKYWAHDLKVDGFYLKNLENFVDDVNFIKTLQFWKHIIGSGRILIASEEAYKKAKGDCLNVLLSRVDLIDVHLDLNNGINELKSHIEEVVTGTLWSKPYYPWVHWNIGNINSERISTKHVNNTLALTALEFVLPGTVSIFYGDEIGLGSSAIDEVDIDVPEYKHYHNLVPMSFHNKQSSEKNGPVLPWNSKSVLEPKFHFLEVIKRLIKLRLNTPTLYLRAIFKEGNILKNMEIRKTEENLVVIERWYPRRNTCVFVGNLGTRPITTDLSSMFYGGTVVASTNTSLIGEVLYFDKVTFPPNSAIILKLEK